MKRSLALSLSDVVFIMLINVKMPTIVGILTFISRINFVLSRVEHEKSFITSHSGNLLQLHINPCPAESGYILFRKQCRSRSAGFWQSHAQGPQRSDTGEAQTHSLSFSSQALYHWATALPPFLNDPGEGRRICTVFHSASQSTVLIAIMQLKWLENINERILQ